MTPPVGPSRPAGPGGADALTIRELLGVLHRHRYIALAVGGLVSLLTATVLLNSTTLYEAESVLVVQHLNEPIESPKGRFYTEGQYEDDLLNTIGDLITASGTLQMALAEGPLMKNPSYAASRDPTALLSGRLFVTSNEGDSWTIRVKLKDEDPFRAEAGLRSVLDAYLSKQSTLDAEQSDREMSILKREVEETARKLGAARLAEQNFRHEHNILGLNPDTDVRAQRLRDANANRVELTAKLAAIQGVVDQIAAAEAIPDHQSRTGELLRITRINSHPLVKDQQNLVYDHRAAYAEASQVFLEKHPRMIEITAKLREKERQLDDAIAIAKQVVISEYREALGQLDALTDSIDTWTGELARLEDATSQLQILQERTQALKNIHDRLIENLERTKISAQFDRSGIRIADPPHAKRKPVTLKPSVAVAISLVLGMVSGLGTPLLIEIFDTRIRTASTARQIAGVPILGEIPQFRPPKPGSQTGISPQVAEAFRSLRSTLRLSHPPGGRGSVVAILSPADGEGRSTIAAELAVGLAMSGLKVLLVDGDLRNPDQGERFQVHRENGLAHLLAGHPGVMPATTGIENLQLLPGPIATDQAAELLHSHCLEEWLDEARTAYDFIVFDSPPATLYADAQILTAVSDFATIVVRHGQTPRDRLAETIDIVDPQRIKVKGLIYNGGEDRRSELSDAS